MSCGLLILIYSPLLFTPYAFHDNTRYFREYRSDPSIKKSCRHDTQFVPLQKMGRPLTALLECSITTNVDSLEQLQKVRWLNIFFAATALMLLAYWFIKLEFSAISSFAIALSLFTLPALQNNLFMTSMQTQLALALATMAYLLLPNPFMPSQPNPRRRLFLGLLLLGLSFFLYYVYSFVVIILNLSLLLWGRRQSLPVYLKLLFRDLLLLGGYSIAVLASVGLGVNKRDPSMGGYSATVELATLFAKSKQLLLEVFPTALNLWNIYPSRFAGILLLFFIAGGLTIQILKRRHQVTTPAFFASLGLILGTCCVFNLATPLVDYVLFRTLFLISCFIILLSLYATQGWLTLVAAASPWRKTFAGFTVLLAVIGSLSAARNTNRNVMNAVIELGFVQTELARQLNEKTERIHFVQADTKNYGFNGYRSAGPDEFNNNTTQYAMFDQFGFFARLALLQFRSGNSFRLQECNDSQENCVSRRETSSLVVTFNRPHESYWPSPNTAVVDMGILARAMKHRN